MVFLTKKQLLVNEVYYGSTKMTNGKSVSALPDVSGSGIYQYGSFPQGNGITPYGSGIMSKGSGIIPYGGSMVLVGSGFSSLVKSAKKALKPMAQKVGRELIKKAVPIVKDQLTSRIKNDTLRGLVNTGVDTGAKMADKGVRGITDVNNYKKTLMSGVKDAGSQLKSKYDEGGISGLKKSIGFGYGKTPASRKVAKFNVDDAEEAGVSYQDRPLKRGLIDQTESNSQLMLLKNVIRSRPLSKTVK